MNGIKMTYSWGDEEALIECEKENAWAEMLRLVAEEVRIVTEENEENASVKYYYNALEIDLHYHSDDEYCYYRYVEDEEDYYRNDNEEENENDDLYYEDEGEED